MPKAQQTQNTQAYSPTLRAVLKYVTILTDNVAKALAQYFPLEVGNRRMEIKNIRFQLPFKLNEWLTDPIPLQHNVKLRDGDWDFKIKGDVYIYENNKLVAKKTLTLLNAPLKTSRSTFIRGGVEYIIFNQMRRKPGIYVGQSDAGKYEARINSSKGRNFQIVYSDLHELQLEFGSSHFNLYNVLKGLGVDDATLFKYWGKDHLEEQKKLAINTPAQTLKALYKQLYFGDEPPSDPKKLREAILKYFQDKTGVDPDVVEKTLGQRFETVGPGELVLTAAKLLKVIDGKAKPDNQNSIFFKSFHSDVDLLTERFALMLPKIVQKLKVRLRHLSDPAKILATRPFQEPFDTFWTSTALTHIPEESNPLDIITNAARLTPLGAGGYTNMRMLPLSARMVDNSHLSFIDPVHTPEGSKAGLMLFMPPTVYIRDRTAYQVYYDVKRQKMVELPHSALYNKKVVFPDQVKWVGGKPQPVATKVKAMDFAKDKIVEIPLKEADYIIPHFASMFSLSTLFIPGLNADHANRATMASKMVEQALPLANPEPPLVMTKIKSNQAENILPINIEAPKDGVIKKVDPNEGVIVYEDGTKIGLYTHFPLNTNTGFNIKKILVKPGDKVKKGQLIAISNFMDEKGTYSYGKNLKVAYFPYGLLNLEDGVVVSESAAKKLTSEHYYTFTIKKSANVIFNKQRFRNINPTQFTEEQLNKLDDKGIVKKGVKLNPGDPIAIYLKRYVPTPDEVLLGKAFKVLRKEYVTDAEIWTKPVEGKVINVVENPRSFKVVVRSYEPARVGDKLAGRHGNKGVIVKILPDNQMPHSEDGKPIDVIISPLSVPSRINTAQLIETLAGKIARKVGKPIEISPFEKDLGIRVKKAADKLGVKEKETIYDPLNPKRKIKAVVGYQYIMKLRQQSEKGLSGRGFRGPYDVNLQPIKGTAGGAKTLDWMTLQGLAAHGVSDIIKEKMSYTSEYNPEFWIKLINGEPLPAPKTPFATEKFMALLAPTGIRLERTPKGFLFRPMTDDDILKISNGEITNPSAVVRDKDLMPEKGGLFDTNITGGLNGDRWAHVKLPKPIPNPSMIGPIAAITGLHTGEVEAIAMGRMYIDENGNKVSPNTKGALTGGEALERLLKKIDVDKAIAETEQALKRARKGNRDKLNKKLRYLRALKKMGVNPAKAYILHYLPVIPPKFRSIYPTASGDIRVPSVTLAYKDLGVVIQQLKDPALKDVPEEFKRPLYAALYKGAKALAGLGDPIGVRQYTGILQEIKGSQNKYGFYQSKILVKKQNVAGRAVIGGDPNLKIDEIGVPEELAWKIFEPLIISEIKKAGKTYLEAVKEYDDRTPLAKQALEAVINKPDTFILANRAPSLHQWNILAFKPKLIKDPKNLQLKLHPMVLTPFNADFDGDAMNVFVPVTPKAKRDAEKMLPSKNTIKWGHDKFLLGPISESMLTIYKLSKPERKTQKHYSDFNQLERDVLSGERKPTDVVTLKGKRTTYGIEKLKQYLLGYWDGKEPLTKKRLYDILKKIAKERPQDIREVIDNLKDLSRDFMFDINYSFGLEDLVPVAEKAKRVAKQLKGKPVKEWDKTFLKVVEQVNPNHPLLESVASGARGKPSQIRQLAGFVRPDVPANFTTGLSAADYWSIVNEARAGVIGRSIETAKPGEVVKQLLAVTQPLRVIAEDGPDPGLELPITDPSIKNRYLARPVIVKGKVVAKVNTLLTPETIKFLKQLGVKKVFVKSPLTSRIGITSKSFGLLDNGKPPQPGLPIGVIAAQAVGEPSAQLVLNKFHGVQGLKDPISEFSRVLTVPDEGPEFASISPVDGEVVDLTHRRTLRYIVIKDKKGQKHRIKVYPSRKIKVKIGDKVTKGQLLTDGEINPKYIADTVNFFAAQNYLVNRMQKIYEDAGIKIDRRMFEVLARALTDYAEITDPGDDPEYVVGDVVLRSEVERKNKVLKQKGLKPIKYKPTILGIHRAPFTTPPKPFTAMVAGKIIPTLQEAAAMHIEEPFKQDSPVPMLVDPSEFDLFNVNDWDDKI